MKRLSRTILALAAVAAVCGASAQAVPMLGSPEQTVSSVGTEYDSELGRDIGYVILTWNNISPNIQDNNQIAAETGFGSNEGLYDIDPLEPTFILDELLAGNVTYEINQDSSVVDFNGLINEPGDQLQFKYKFDSTYWVSQMQSYLSDPTQNISNFDTLKMSYITAIARGDYTGTLDFNQVAIVCPRTLILTNNVPIPWLQAVGYTNDFNSAALADPDLDLFLNWQEYHADTDPTNAASYLSLSITSSNMVYQSSTNCAYSLEWCESLSSNVWNTLTNNISGNGGVMSIPATNSAPTRFYRLKAWRE